MQTTEQKMDKVHNSLSNHVARGNRNNQTRSWDLMDRYNDTKEQMRDAGKWEAWCSKKGYCRSHDAGDSFA